ncbi:MAG: SPOR domain-containing protein [Trueperaceae bacterium]|nr:MAG: SPOR domain-containing protein [Trueperaceae bacterium]
MRRTLVWLAVSVASSLLLGTSAAQPWTIQTVAYRDFRDASTVAESLRTLGFDAYTEFAMFKGKQFTRVRVGCFTSKLAAENMASSLRKGITREAVPLPLTPGADVQACIDLEIGFLKPSVWQLDGIDGEAILFYIEIGGKEAYVRHDGARWEVLQSRPETYRRTISSEVRFQQIYLNDVALVQLSRMQHTINLCEGSLLWQGSNVVVVEQQGAVVACRLESPLQSRAPADLTASQ